MKTKVTDLFKHLDEVYSTGHCKESLDKARWYTVVFYNKGLFSAWDSYVREHENNIYGDNIEENVECINLATQCKGWDKEVIGQLAASPTEDGDVTSKNSLHWLRKNNLSVRVANKNEFGANCLNGRGWIVWKELNKDKENK